ncbi:MAG: zinc-binding dehydrogenase [Solirubrobacteraceae bacterium]
MVAAVGTPARGEGLIELGAAEGVSALADITAPVDFAIDNVGGQLLADVLTHLTTGAHLLSVGMSSQEPTTIDFEQLRNRAGGTRIEAFTVGPRFGRDLAYRVSAIEARQLKAEIVWRGSGESVGSWDSVDDAAGALLERRVRGKVVLEIPQ